MGLELVPVDKKDDKSRRSRRRRKHKKRSKYSDSDSENDLEKDLHPVGYYINDKLEMINQIFTTLKSSQVHAMCPDELKHISTSELKELCLTELMGMSKKRIRHILAGEEMLSSSEEDSPSDAEDGIDTPSTLALLPPPPRPPELPSLPQMPQIPIPPDIAAQAKKLAQLKASVVKDDSIQLFPGMAEDESMQSEHFSMPTNIISARNVAKSNQYVAANSGSGNKQSMEILELEMRARAIRAMLETEPAKTEQEKPDTEQNSATNTGNNSPVGMETADADESNDGTGDKPRRYRRKDLSSDDDWNEDSDENDDTKALLEKMASIQKELETVAVDEKKEPSEAEEGELDEGELPDDGETVQAIETVEKKKKYKRRSRRRRSRSYSRSSSRSISRSPERAKSPPRQTPEEKRRAEIREKYEKIKAEEEAKKKLEQEEATKKEREEEAKKAKEEEAAKEDSKPTAMETEETATKGAETPPHLNKEELIEFKVERLVNILGSLERKIEFMQTNMFKKSADSVGLMEEEIRETNNSADDLKVQIYKYNIQLKKEFEEEVAQTGVEDAFIQSKLDEMDSTMNKCKKLYESLTMLRRFYDMRKDEIKEEQKVLAEKQKIEEERAQQEREELEKMEKEEEEKRTTEKLKQEKELAERAEIERKRALEEKAAERKRALEEKARGEIVKQRAEIERKAREEEKAKKGKEDDKDKGIDSPDTPSPLEDDNEKNNQDKEEEEDVIENMSWGSRYYQSDKVKKVVEESTLLSKIRRNKKMKINIAKRNSVDTPTKTGDDDDSMSMDKFKEITGQDIPDVALSAARDTDMRVLPPAPAQDDAHKKYLLELQEYYKKMQSYYEQYGKQKTSKDSNYEQWLEAQQGNQDPSLPDEPKKPWKKDIPKKADVKTEKLRSKPKAAPAKNPTPSNPKFVPLQPIKASTLPIPPAEKEKGRDADVVGLIGEEEGKKFETILNKYVDEEHEAEDSEEEDLWGAIMGDD